MPEQFTVFNGVSELGQTLPESQLQINLIDFMNWGLLNIGGFDNVQLNSSGAYGANLSTLRLSSDPRYSSGQVWDGFRANWVWESGLNYHHQPISISGVYINNTFHAANSSGAFAHHVNYPNGQVVFNTPIATSSVVRAEFSYRKVNVTGDGVPWFREFIAGSYRPDNHAFSLHGSGNFDGIRENQVQYPAIVVELSPSTKFIPAELGGAFYRQQDVLFHIFSEDPRSQKTLRDIIKFQENKTFYLYDVDRVVRDNHFPLNFNGSLASGAMVYRDLLTPAPSGYRWKRGIFSEITGERIDNSSFFYWSTLRVKFQLDFPKVWDST